MRGWCDPVSRRRARLSELGSDRDMWLVARVVIFAASSRLMQRLSPRRLRWLLLAVDRMPRGRSRRPEWVSAHVDTALDVGRPLVPTGCFGRGMTRFHFLRGDAGIDVRLCFGICRIDGQTVGHCWLVRDEAPYLEPVDLMARCASMLTLP